jgi:hypothetical protein
MRFPDRLLGKQSDPSRDWKGLSLPIPDFDIAEMRFGFLRFGDPFEAAAFLGRPDRSRWTQPNYCEFLYASGGFQIDYDKGRFAYLAFYIGPDPYLPKHKALEFASPRLSGGTTDGYRLSRDTDRAKLEQLFGAPDSADTEARETILFYTRTSVTMEFELEGETGRLKRWNLYPK